MQNKLSTVNQERIALLLEIKKHAHAVQLVAKMEAIKYRIDEDIRAIERTAQ